MRARKLDARPRFEDKHFLLPSYPCPHITITHLVAAIFLMAAAWGGRSVWAAQDPTERRVVLAITGCPAGAEPAIRRMVGLEIGDLLADAGEAAEADHLAVFCTDAWARLEVNGPGRPRQVDRILGLHDFPADAVPRVLALAGVEMLAALSPAVRRRVETGAAVQEPEEPARAPVMQPTAPTVWRADVSAVWHGFPGENGLSLWGGRGRIGRELGQRLSLGLDLEAASGSRAVVLGQVRGVLASAGAFFGVHAGAQDLFAELALGWRLGIAYLAGNPGASNVEGDSASHAWGGPALSLRAWAGRGRLALVFCGEFGLALLGAEGLAGGTTAASVTNFWVSFALGVGIRLGG
jgi:hypothetical protein